MPQQDSLNTEAAAHSDVELSPGGVEVDWHDYGEDFATVVINAPGTGDLQGFLYTNPTDSADRVLFVNMFRSEDPGSGQGKKLLSLFKEEGLKHSATTMRGHFTSQASLGAFASVVGDPSEIAFSDRNSGQPVAISFEEAMQQPKAYFAAAPISKA